MATNLYIGVLAVFATAALAYGLATERWSAVDPAMLALLVLVAAATQRVPVFLFRSSAVSVSFAATIAAYVLYGTGAGLLTNLVCAGVNAFSPRKPFRKVAFNVSSLTVSAFLASSAYQLAGGTVPPGDLVRTIFAVGVSGITYFAATTTFTATVIALSSGSSFAAVWRENYAWMLVNFVATAVNGASLAIAYEGLGFFGAAMFVLPLGVAWYSFHLYMARSEGTRRHNEELVELNAKLREANESLEGSQLSVVEALIATLEAKDDTVGRSAATVSRAVTLARRLGLSDEEILAVRLGALIHDVGKVAVPEQVLRKPGPFSDAEWAIIKTHPAVGAQLLAHVPALAPARPIVLAHHERYDGTGYPRGLRGTEVPMGAQIVSVVDAYSAMTSPRPHRPALSEERALAELRENGGTQFNPAVVTALVAVLAEERRGARPPETTPAFSLQAVRPES